MLKVFICVFLKGERRGKKYITKIMVICHLSPKGSINILVCFVKKYRDSLIIISSYASQKILTKIDLFNNENAFVVSVSEMWRQILSLPVRRMFAL